MALAENRAFDGVSLKIRTERIVEVRRVSLGHSMGLAGLVCLGVIVASPSKPFTYACLTIVGIVYFSLRPVIYARSGTSNNRTAEQEARENFPRFIGKPPTYMDIGSVGVGQDLQAASASGIAYADGRIFVLEEGVAAEIPWDRIRSWNWNVDGYSQTELHGPHAGNVRLSVARSNQVARVLAFRSSGFVVVTSDIEKPEWRFQTRDEAVLKKWAEILTQMSEGRLARS